MAQLRWGILALLGLALAAGCGSDTDRPGGGLTNPPAAGIGTESPGQRDDLPVPEAKGPEAQGATPDTPAKGGGGRPTTQPSPR